MDVTSGDITAVNGVTTGTSHRSRSESVITGAILLGTILATADLEDFGWWSREILTGFPELRHKIVRGWNQHKYEWSKGG